MKIKLNTFSLVLRSKSMFCEHYLLPKLKNIESIKTYFHMFPFQDCFFYLITLLKGFLVLSELLKPAFEKKWQRKMLTNLEK